LGDPRLFQGFYKTACAIYKDSVAGFGYGIGVETVYQRASDTITALKATRRIKRTQISQFIVKSICWKGIPKVGYSPIAFQSPAVGTVLFDFHNQIWSHVMKLLNPDV